MKAADIMTMDVVTAAADATVADAAELMIQHQVSALPVVNSRGKLVGIISEGDLMRRAELGTERSRPWWLELLTSNRKLAAEYVKSHAHRVADLMTAEVITASPDTSVSDIALLLEKHGIKRVPIIRDDKIVGIVSRANIVQGVASGREKVASAPAADDEHIRQAILVEVREQRWCPWLWNVTVNNGAANLWGFVETKAAKKAVGVVAENTPGVVAVNNNIIVRPHSWSAAKPYFE